MEDAKLAAKAAFEWARANLLGLSIFQPDLKAQVEFTVQGLKHSIYSAGYGYAEKPAFIYSIKEILPTLKLVMSEPDKRGRPDIRMVHRLIGKWNYNGTEKLVYVVILEKLNGHFHYDHGIAK